VIRGKGNLRFRRITSRPVDRTSGVICDQVVALSIKLSATRYPARLRRIRYRDPQTGKTLVFLTNNFDLPPRTVADLYRCRWQIELFFKWIKQHLRIKSFFGNTEKRLKTQMLDRRLRLRAHRHRQKTPRPRGQPSTQSCRCYPSPLRGNPASITT